MRNDILTPFACKASDPTLLTNYNADFQATPAVDNITVDNGFNVS